METSIGLTVQHTKHMLWLPTKDVQAAPLDRSLDIITKDPEHTDIDNDSTHNSDITVDLRGPEAVRHPEDPVYDDQDRLTKLSREINGLHQRAAAGEGHSVETWDCIQW